MTSPGPKRDRHGPKGHRLSNPNDAAVKTALRTPCPTCKAEPGQWCVGVGGGRTLGRRLPRIHSTRAVFAR